MPVPQVLESRPSTLRQFAPRILNAVAAQPADCLAGAVLRFDRPPVARLESFRHLKLRELTHRWQVFLDLTLNGIERATTRRRAAQLPAR